MLKRTVLTTALIVCVATAALASPAKSASQQAAATAAVQQASSKVNINTATADQLTSLPHIGPKMAAKIIAYRQKHGAFKSLTDLANVSGIGVKRVTAMQGLAVAS